MSRAAGATARNIKNGEFKWAALSRSFVSQVERDECGTRRGASRRRGGWTRAVPATALTAERFLCASKRRREAVSYRATAEINFTRLREEKLARVAAVQRSIARSFRYTREPFSRRFFRS